MRLRVQAFQEPSGLGFSGGRFRRLQIVVRYFFMSPASDVASFWLFTPRFLPAVSKP